MSAYPKRKNNPASLFPTVIPASTKSKAHIIPTDLKSEKALKRAYSEHTQIQIFHFPTFPKMNEKPSWVTPKQTNCFGHEEIWFWSSVSIITPW